MPESIHVQSRGWWDGLLPAASSAIGLIPGMAHDGRVQPGGYHHDVEALCPLPCVSNLLWKMGHLPQEGDQVRMAWKLELGEELDYS